MPSPYLVLLTAAHTHRHQPAYRAMELLSPPWKDEPFPGWLYAPGPRAVRVGLPHQRIVHASTSRGSVWYADGRQLPEHDDLHWLTLVGAALSHSVKFNPSMSGVLLPAFVSSDARLRPCRRSAVVRLHARRFIDLPDFNATLAELAGYAHASRRVLSQPLGPEFADAMHGHPNPFIARLHAAAARTELGPGMHLPVSFEHAPAHIHGVLRLDAQREPGVFESTVLLSHDDPPLAEGRSPLAPRPARSSGTIVPLRGRRRHRRAPRRARAALGRCRRPALRPRGQRPVAADFLHQLRRALPRRPVYARTARSDRPVGRGSAFPQGVVAAGPHPASL